MEGGGGAPPCPPPFSRSSPPCPLRAFPPPPPGAAAAVSPATPRCAFLSLVSALPCPAFPAGRACRGLGVCVWGGVGGAACAPPPSSSAPVVPGRRAARAVPSARLGTCGVAAGPRGVFRGRVRPSPGRGLRASARVGCPPCVASRRQPWTVPPRSVGRPCRPCPPTPRLSLLPSGPPPPRPRARVWLLSFPRLRSTSHRALPACAPLPAAAPPPSAARGAWVAGAGRGGEGVRRAGVSRKREGSGPPRWLLGGRDGEEGVASGGGVGSGGGARRAWLRHGPAAPGFVPCGAGRGRDRRRGGGGPWPRPVPSPRLASPRLASPVPHPLSRYLARPGAEV